MFPRYPTKPSRGDEGRRLRLGSGIAAVYEIQPGSTEKQSPGVIDEISGPMLREELTLVSGAAEMLHQIDEKGMKLGLVTSTPKKNMVLKLAPLRKADLITSLKPSLPATIFGIKNRMPSRW